MTRARQLPVTIASGSVLLLTMFQAGCGRDEPLGGASDTADIVSSDPGSEAMLRAGALRRANPIDHVDPFIGTDDSNSPNPVGGGAGGSTYPGAVVPFGMVQLSPDTPTASPSGFRFSDTQIEQFSLTHFDGAGCANNEDLPFLPFVGAVTSSPAANWSAYRTAYDKATQTARPGYYRARLASGIDVELTATTRTGMARLTYPASTTAQFLIHAGRSATGTRAGTIDIAGPDRITGSATAGGFCGSGKTFTIYFAAQFDAPFTAHGTWSGSTLAPGSASATGSPAGAYLTFDTTTDNTVQAKIGISFVSIANAQANLDAENPGWSFDQLRAAAAQRWHQALSRIEVSGGDDANLNKFYTALYHVFQSPNVASDVNGQYMGFDRSVHTADGWTVYQNYSGWDIIRSWTHLISAIAPEAPDIIRSMVEDGIQGGLLPFWTHQNVETNVMVGDPGTVNVANAYAMGVRGFDTSAALGLMLKSAQNPADTQRFALSDWLDLHYVDDASISLEYAMADFAISRFAGALGDTATRDAFLVRSNYWKESWNPADGYIEPRVATPSGDAARIYEVQVFGPGAPTTNLALGGATTASGQCNANETPPKAVNGSWTGGLGDKWCDNTSAQKWWQVDLGGVKSIDTVVIYHAGAGGETPTWNTQDFVLEVSTDGTTWETAATVTGNTADISTTPLSVFAARYLRLEILHAVQTGTVGAWDCQPLDPARDSCGYVEGNAAQYVWMVPHNLEGLFTLMGGHDVAVQRLDSLFTALNAGTSNPFFYIGNEPEHGTPWTYNFAQAPWKTQRTVRRIIDETFTTDAGGLPGNDDLGATSAWLVWAYLGMYPMIPGSDVLVVHGPQFPAIHVHLATGKTLEIRGAGAGPSASFLQDMRVNGAATTRSWLRYGDLAGGATLQFTMGSAPNQSWGSGADDVPPSFAP